MKADSKRVTVDLEPSLYELLRARSFQRHVSMADVVREALARELEGAPDEN